MGVRGVGSHEPVDAQLGVNSLSKHHSASWVPGPVGGGPPRPPLPARHSPCGFTFRVPPRWVFRSLTAEGGERRLGLGTPVVLAGTCVSSSPWLDLEEPRTRSINQVSAACPESRARKPQRSGSTSWMWGVRPRILTHTKVYIFGRTHHLCHTPHSRTPPRRLPAGTSPAHELTGMPSSLPQRVPLRSCPAPSRRVPLWSCPAPSRGASLVRTAAHTPQSHAPYMNTHSPNMCPQSLHPR